MGVGLGVRGSVCARIEDGVMYVCCRGVDRGHQALEG